MYYKNTNTNNGPARRMSFLGAIGSPTSVPKTVCGGSSINGSGEEKKLARCAGCGRNVVRKYVTGGLCISCQQENSEG